VIIGRRIMRMSVTTSTMDEIDRYAKRGEAEGIVVVADKQTSGKGRAGRTWQSNPGEGLLFSVLLRPRKTPSEIAVFPLIIGLAVSEAIESTSEIRCKLKWPNDILIDEKKIAGILTTSRVSGESIEYLNIGIGINVAGGSHELPQGGTSLSGESSISIDKDRLLERVLVCLNDTYASFCTSGSSGFVRDWNAKAAFAGERVTIVTGPDELEGIMRGVDDQGALLLELDNGSNERIVAGELTRGPRPVDSPSGKVAL
jgi:BirA family biotin operon repressor/biotin-[acetyl-CoA-carboxylase] ligase